MALGQTHHDLLVDVRVAEEGTTQLRLPSIIVYRQLRIVPNLSLLHCREFLATTVDSMMRLRRLGHGMMLPADILRGYVYGDRSSTRRSFLFKVLIDKGVD